MDTNLNAPLSVFFLMYFPCCVFYRWKDVKSFIANLVLSPKRIISLISSKTALLRLSTIRPSFVGLINGDDDDDDDDYDDDDDDDDVDDVSAFKVE